ncbi:PR domain zinc finger protein 5-like [Folsomia candida]|uniref:PR domain zinc finger protein 5-like n=1 Tax=Folsomia candida TaxID=158441 RepID=UPI001604D598|nr:PR domain zinc finger protein 5-like [Folsomia candida]
MLKNPPTLHKHIKTVHTNLDRPSCDICHRVFFTPGNLQRHMDTVHSTIKRPRLPCGFPGCEKTYLNKRDVSMHIKSEHAENPTRFPCTLCCKEFKTRRELESHISTHTTEKAYTCSTCGRRFASHTTMKTHEIIHLEKSTRRIFMCELSPHISSRKADLQRHVQIMHENRRNHSCTFCDKRFSTPTNMKNHVEARHPTNAEKIHSCDKCEYKSHSKGNLAQHSRRHNPARRRECYFCQKQFVFFSELEKHIHRHTLEWW